MENRKAVKKQIGASRVQKLWKKLERKRDKVALGAIVEAYQPLVKFYASCLQKTLDIQNGLLDFGDFFSAGTLGLYKAIAKFDPSQGIEFESFAEPWIKGAMFDELRQLDFFKRAGRRKIKAIRRFLGNTEGIINEEELAQTLNLPLEKTREMFRLASIKQLHLFSIRNEEGGCAFELRDERTENPCQIAENHESQSVITRFLDEDCTIRERQMLILYYFEELTMEQIGVVLGVTESRVCQMHNRILDNLSRKLDAGKKAKQRARH